MDVSGSHEWRDVVVNGFTETDFIQISGCEGLLLTRPTSVSASL